MIGSWRVVLTCTIAFYTYQSTFLSKKLNVEEKLIGRLTPTVHPRENEKSQEIPLVLDLVEAFLKEVQYSLTIVTIINIRVLICLSFQQIMISI